MFNKNGYNQLHPLSQHFHRAEEGHYFSAAPAVDGAAAFYQHQDLGGLNDADPWATCPKTTKKDRHSKIYTSQGPRDRRVRLSIGVARRFFDLQEILGFDKPSKTLDWLLTNSNGAINDLMHAKETENGAVSSSEADSGEPLEVSSDSKRKAKQDLAKESRAKARARARERTREKMCIKHLHHDIPLQYDNHSDSIFHSHPPYQPEESIVIKTKLKHFISNTSNYALPSPNYITPTEINWDICAILDSHNFLNSTSDN